MKKFLNKKMILIFIGILSAMLLIASILLYFFLKQDVVFKLVGEEEVVLNVYEQYNELGFVASDNKKDISSTVVVDMSKVNSNQLGTYEVTYTMKYEDKEIVLSRKVKVIDKEAPVITLNGEEKVVIQEGSVYQDLGCHVVDNFDEQVSNKIQIVDKVNTNVPGIYEVIFSVVDNSGNKSQKSRKVIVVKKDSLETDSLDIMDSNQVTTMDYVEDGIFIEGYVKDNDGTFKLKLCKENKSDCTSYDMNKKDKYYYNGNIQLSTLDKGVYYMWVSSKIDEKVINKMDMQHRLARARIGDKLVTFYYEEDTIKLIVNDFEYQYDIVIDPGHGGTDPGASNDMINEKELNLVQSLYEKERYEQHGLKVLLLRTDMSYGLTLGESSWPPVRKKAYALGFYGVVSKISYSNHHNSSEDLSMSGWEIIVPAQLTKEDLKEVYKISEQWNKDYPGLEQHARVYTRNYNTGSIFSKGNEEQYYFTDYYAVLRIPKELFNVKNVLFEGSYLSNPADFDWYYTKQNWRELSEVKIKTYVELLGVKYIEPS